MSYDEYGNFVLSESDLREHITRFYGPSEVWINGYIDRVQKAGMPVVEIAFGCTKKRWDAVFDLINRGMHPDCPRDWPPYFVAVFDKEYDVVARLLKLGANPFSPCGQFENIFLAFCYGVDMRGSPEWCGTVRFLAALVPAYVEISRSGSQHSCVYSESDGDKTAAALLFELRANPYGWAYNDDGTLYQHDWTALLERAFKKVYPK